MGCVHGVLLLTVAIGQAPAGADAPLPDEKDQRKQRADAAIKIAAAHAAEYDMYAGPKGKTKLTLHKAPRLRWTNPVPQEMGMAPPEVHGGVFLWTRQGCPQVVASIFKWYAPYRHVTHELQSLCPHPVVALRDGQREWYPRRQGAQRRLVAGAAPPADTPRGRERQMRALAREFAAEKTDTKDRTTRLRLLAQPLYRYKSRDPVVQDGSLFAFVEGTDPEVILLLEVHRHGDQMDWYFAAGRLNHLRLKLTRGQRTVWEAPALFPQAKRIDRGEPYTHIIRRPTKK